MKDGDKETVGTKITLYLNEDSTEFANEYRAREVIEKYCSFMPVPIFLNNAKAEPEYETIEKDELNEKDTIVETIVEEAKTEEKENEDGPRRRWRFPRPRRNTKILKRPVSLKRCEPSVEQAPQRVYGGGVQGLLPQSIYGL